MQGGTVLARQGLSDAEWLVIEDLFPPPKATGRPPLAARAARDGICWILRAGAPWRDLPQELGPWETVFAPFNRWTSDGTLAAAVARLKSRFRAEDRFDHRLWSIAGRIVRAHRGAGGGGEKDPNEPADQALGRSRGGFSPKIQVICDGEGRPLNAELSPGQTPETPLLEDLWNTTEVTDQEWKHFIPPDALAGDKADRSAKILDPWDWEGVQPVIPEKGKKANDVDHPHFDREADRRRNVVERLFGRLQEFRRLFGRVEKTAVNSLGMIHAACIRLYLAELSG